ncbi:uncharacterized protein LOC111820951 [Trichechus manatus latirostris]|uniref:Uncharacterized protein LOC111820951 n=1 Tax=Trichechus manatus latirostris TaxID=127582 RepID=A0A2Y9R377_TRIMA|nr:uncharacterized protein LOC111820951 [Trichechus manatus latirostris]
MEKRSGERSGGSKGTNVGQSLVPSSVAAHSLGRSDNLAGSARTSRGTGAEATESSPPAREGPLRFRGRCSLCCAGLASAASLEGPGPRGLPPPSLPLWRGFGLGRRRSEAPALSARLRTPAAAASGRPGRRAGRRCVGALSGEAVRGRDHGCQLGRDFVRLAESQASAKRRELACVSALLPPPPFARPQAALPACVSARRDCCEAVGGSTEGPRCDQEEVVQSRQLGT